MSKWTRRSFLGTVGGSAVIGLSGGRRLWARSAPPGQDAAADPMAALAQSLAGAPWDQAFALAEEALRQGASWEFLEGAIFLAGVTEIQARPPGGKHHAVLVVESVYQLAEASPPQQRLLPVLWNLDDLKAGQAQDLRQGDWRLPPVPARDYSGAEAAQRELAGALEKWDGERADHALAYLAPRLPQEELMEALWPAAIRDFGGIGHKTIHAAHTDRVLRRIGWKWGQPALRALAHGLLNPSSEQFLAVYAASEAALAGMRDGGSGAADPARSLELAQGIRHASADQAREQMTRSWNEGVAPAVLWDGLRLAAGDLFARLPTLLPVHPTTVTNSLFHVFRTTRVERTRRLALLQAAAWLPLFRAALQQHRGLSMKDPGIDALVTAPDAEPPPLEEVLAAPAPARVLHVLSREEQLPAFAAALRHHLYRGVTQNHQPKFAAALLEDAAYAHPRWRPALLASALQYLPNAATATAAAPWYERAQALARRFG